MSLYHEAASVLAKSSVEKVSIRTVVFAKKDWKNPVKVLLALASEAAKWSSVLSEVVENSSILRTEHQLTPLLALVLVHDLLLAKRGVGLPSTHGLNSCVLRNKARLQAELTKSRIRRQCSSIDQLRTKIEVEASDAAHAGEIQAQTKHPRWIRINVIRTSLEAQLATTFKDFAKVDSIQAVLHAGGNRIIFLDEHIPDLLAIPSSIDLTSSKAYREGQIIFQDKASCFPAYLLNPQSTAGDAIDACAAPGNKTTHLAALLSTARSRSPTQTAQTIFACEKDIVRSRTLTKMVSLAGADSCVQVKQNQNFLKLDPVSPKFARVTKLLLDPSCSGSGIVSRDQGAITVHLPQLKEEVVGKHRKRKRDEAPCAEPVEEQEPTAFRDDAKLKDRLEKLADFQLRLLRHAMSFPAAEQISYSTCSIHAEENEGVVVRALCSEIAFQQGWTIQRRELQVPGLQKWHIRGHTAAIQSLLALHATIGVQDSALDIAEACIRCEKRGDDGTMGFFVAGFVRNPQHNRDGAIQNTGDSTSHADGSEDWNGFD